MAFDSRTGCHRLTISCFSHHIWPNSLVIYPWNNKNRTVKARKKMLYLLGTSSLKQQQTMWWISWVSLCLWYAARLGSKEAYNPEQPIGMGGARSLFSKAKRLRDGKYNRHLPENSNSHPTTQATHWALHSTVMAEQQSLRQCQALLH